MQIRKRSTAPRGSFLPEEAATLLSASTRRRITARTTPAEDRMGDRIRGMGIPVDDEQAKSSFLFSLLARGR